jgi:flagellar L-ring protein precursor FlgH
MKRPRACRRSVLALAVLLGISGVTLAQSLYQADGFRGLTSDRRAFRPGDALTVLLVETTSASATADTATDRKAAVGVGARSNNSDRSLNIDLNDEFSARGRVQRTGRLVGQITVVVQEIDANGQLVIRGEQVLEVNNEKQEIRVEGRVRPVDVTDTNTVLSTRIAEARVIYLGRGVLGDRSQPGAITRFLNWMGLL